MRAQRFDGAAETLAADLRYYHDASDQRVIKRATIEGGEGNPEDRYAPCIGHIADDDTIVATDRVRHAEIRR